MKLLVTVIKNIIVDITLNIFDVILWILLWIGQKNCMENIGNICLQYPWHKAYLAKFLHNANEFQPLVHWLTNYEIGNT